MSILNPSKQVIGEAPTLEARLDAQQAELEAMRALLAGTLTTQLSGSTVEVGGKTYGFDGPRTLYGKAADRPAAAAAHAVVPFAFYSAADQPGLVYQTDGDNWQAL